MYFKSKTRTAMQSIKIDWVAIKTVKYMRRIRFHSEFPMGETKYLLHHSHKTIL